MSSLAITKGADVFSIAIAVAPVTNWRYYDNIYKCGSIYPKLQKRMQVAMMQKFSNQSLK